MNTATINKKTAYYLESRFFEADGKRFEITGTRSTGPGAHDSVHMVKGATESKEMKHETLIKLFRAGRLKASDGATGNERGG